jgi:peptidoglycan/LPS O-acetylase OafA/YrhL
MSSDSGFRLGHRPALDGLRGVFIFLVLTVHAGVPFMQGGGLGVDGFFALSGFLITCLLLQEWQQYGSISLRRFYFKRALRLLPALYALLAVVGLITLLFLTGEGAVATGRAMIVSFLYCTNLAPLFFQDYHIGLGLMNHTWSLALEEQFYLVWPVLLIGLLALRPTGKQLAMCIGALVALGPLWRVWIISTGSDALYYLGSDTRADTLLIGCTLGALAAGGMIRPSAPAARLTRWMALAGIAVIAYLVVDPSWHSTTWFAYYLAAPITALCAAASLLHLVVSPKGRMARLLSWKPLVQLGVVSYGVYLWHNPVFHLVRTGSNGWLDLPMQFTRLVLTAVLVIVSYRYIERPMLRKKARLSRRADPVLESRATRLATQEPL